MDNIFKQHFSNEAKNLLIKAQQMAEAQSKKINTVHLLTGLVKVGDSIAQEILITHDLDMDKLELSASIEKSKEKKKLGVTKETKKILKNSLNLAKKQKHKMVTPEHILYSICKDKSSQGYKLLTDLDIDPEEIADEIKGLFDKAEKISTEGPSQAQMGQMPGQMPAPDQLGTRLMSPGMQKSKNKKLLPSFTTNLVKQAEKDKLDPLIGRKKALSRLVKILNRRTKNNPVLIGEAGVGKTAIVEGLAQKIADNDVPDSLNDKKILTLDLGMILAGTKYRGQFENRIKKIVDEIKKDDDVIIFLDELHTLVGAGAAEGSIDAANIIKPALAKGELRLIGATTLEEYRKHIEKDNALERRLQMIKVEEPNKEKTIAILQGLKKNYEKHHKVKITDTAIEKAVELSSRYITDRYLPDKAVDLIDEASSAKNLKDTKKGKKKKLQKLQDKIKKIVKEKEEAVMKQDYEKAANQRSKELKLKKKILDIEKEAKEEREEILKVGEEDIAKVVSEWTGVPVTNLVEEEQKKYKDLAKNIKKKIVGQDKVVEKTANAIKRSRTGISSESQPIGTFVFLGPTGVGKTELAKVLSQTLFEREDALIRLDMSEFMEKHNVSKMVGAPPGYVGYEDAGKLTEQVRRNPYSVVLIDELEKAHPDVQNILLQILEDGQITDGQGKVVDFTNTIIIMTSNIGTKELTKQAAVGFQGGQSEKEKLENKYKKLKSQILSKFKKQFRPEFINRIDEILVFKPLDQDTIKKIVKIKIDELKKRLKKQKGIKLKVTKAALSYIAEKSFKPDLGARPIRRNITRMIEDKISEKILDKEIDKDSKKVKVSKQRGNGLKIS